MIRVPNTTTSMVQHGLRSNHALLMDLPWEITQIHNQYEDAGEITSCIEVKPHLRSLYNQSWESNHKPTHKK